MSAPSSALITPPHLYPNVRILSRHTHFVTSARIYISIFYIFYIKRIFACELYVLSSLRGKCRFLLKYEARFLCTFTLHFPLWILARFLKCFTDSLAFLGSFGVYLSLATVVYLFSSIRHVFYCLPLLLIYYQYRFSI